jgi:GNAT superfamily N-acetyltransferase
MTKFIIRNIELVDIPKVAMCGRIIAEDFAYDLKPDVAHYIKFLTDFIGTSEFHFHRLVERTDTVYGFMLAHVNFNLYSGELQCTKATWVVRSAAAGYGRKLVKVCEDWAKGVGCTMMHVSSPNEKVAQLLERAGYKFTEATFTKELK